jgi:hypothetical protein
MSAIIESIEIARKPEDVFAYLDQLERHSEWQEDIVKAEVKGDGPVGVGTRGVETRKMGNREMLVEYEITEHEPPRLSSFKGLNGPIRVVGTVTVDPVDDGKGSRVTINLDFEGKGMGKLMVGMARKQARKQIPVNQKKLKEILESS